MKALSLAQPYASLVALGLKTLETRRTRIHYRGDLVICSTRTPDAEAWDEIDKRSHDAWCTLRDRCTNHELLLPSVEDLPLGVTVALVEVVGCRPLVEEDWPSSFFYAPGRWAWELANIRPLERVCVRGMNGQWPIDDSLVREEKWGVMGAPDSTVGELAAPARARKAER